MLKFITISSQFETTIFFTIDSQAEDADNKGCYLLFIYLFIYLLGIFGLGSIAISRIMLCET